MKIISIIIATYNAGNVIKECLNSIIQQKSEEIELIIIDGQSKDNTLDVLAEYKSQIDVLVSEKDAGVYDAWNKGIALSNSQWIMFVGADDTLLPGSLEKYMRLLKTKNLDNYDYICAQNEYINQKGKYLFTIKKEPKPNKMKTHMSAAHVGSLHHRTNLFGEVGLYNYKEFRICSDYELLLRKKELKYYYFEEKIAIMMTGGMSFSLKAIYETYLIRKKHKTLPYIMNVLYLLKGFLYFLYKKNIYQLEK